MRDRGMIRSVLFGYGRGYRWSRGDGGRWIMRRSAIFREVGIKTVVTLCKQEGESHLPASGRGSGFVAFGGLSS